VKLFSISQTEDFFVMADRRIPRKTQEIRKLLDRIPQVSFVDWYVFSYFVLDEYLLLFLLFSTNKLIGFLL
jgi:hypothetical protein